METMETAAAQAFFTPEECLAKERKALTKSDWDLTAFRSLDAVFQLPSIGCELSLEAIYAKIQFS